MTRTLQQLEPYLQGHWKLDTDFKDHSANSNDGTPTAIKWKPTRRGLKPEFNGSSSKIAIGNVYDGIKSVSFWVKLSSTTESLIDLNATATVDINAGTVRGNNFTSPTIYIDGQATASLSDLTGFHKICITTATGINASAVDIGEIAASFGEIIIDDIRFYSDVMTATEELNLYNETKHRPGIIPAERSYTHQLGIKPENGLVLGFDGHAKNADGTFQDLSGNSNHGTNNGTSRDVGYFGEVRSFDGVDDYVSMSNFVLTFPVTIIMWVKPSLGALSNTRTFLSRNGDTSFLWYYVTGSKVISIYDNSDHFGSVNILNENEWQQMGITFDINGDGSHWYNGVQDISFTAVSEPTNPFELRIAEWSSYDWNGLINHIHIYNRVFSLSEIKSKFNELAILPLFHINFADYPDNENVSWTDNEPVPYSHMQVGSNGTFKVDDDQLVCTEDTSTLTLQNNHEFDGSEYIIIDIDGTKYSGTETITQGTVTVSITQGSRFITVAMSDTDVLNSIDIQFRAEVS